MPRPCRFFFSPLGGGCALGELCRFAHSGPPCRAYALSGGCRYGDACAFAHDEPAQRVPAAAAPAAVVAASAPTPPSARSAARSDRAAPRSGAAAHAATRSDVDAEAGVAAGASEDAGAIALVGAPSELPAGALSGMQPETWARREGSASDFLAREVLSLPGRTTVTWHGDGLGGTEQFEDGICVAALDVNFLLGDWARYADERGSLNGGRRRRGGAGRRRGGAAPVDDGTWALSAIVRRCLVDRATGARPCCRSPRCWHCRTHSHALRSFLVVPGSWLRATPNDARVAQNTDRATGADLGDEPYVVFE